MIETRGKVLPNTHLDRAKQARISQLKIPPRTAAKLASVRAEVVVVNLGGEMNVAPAEFFFLGAQQNGPHPPK